MLKNWREVICLRLLQGMKCWDIQKEKRNKMLVVFTANFEGWPRNRLSKNRKMSGISIFGNLEIRNIPNAY